MKKLQKVFSILLTVCMCMSLLSVSAFADEGNAGGGVPGEAEPSVETLVYRCQKDAHTHTDACYTTLSCEKTVHSEACYTEDVLTCENHAVSQDLICELHAHERACYHTHSDVTGACYDLDCQDTGAPTCGKTEETVECELTDVHTAHDENCARHQHAGGCYHQCNDNCYDLICENTDETLECGIESDHVHDAVACYEDHAHIRTCYDDEADCGKNEHIHDGTCIPPSDNYYTNPINENIDVTLYNYGSYINVGEDKSLQFGWHNNLNDDYGPGRPYEGIDGPAMQTTGEVFTGYAEIWYSNKIWNFPTVERLLNEDGYPQIAATQGYKYNKGGNEIVNQSLEYLFPKTGDALNTGAATTALSDYSKLREEATFIENNGFNSNYESMRFDMEGDGGLFYKGRDGYYTYDSAYTSAYYDQSIGQFLLSDTIIGPSHEGAEKFRVEGLANYAHNFLPFNKIDFENTDQFYQFGNQWVYETDYVENSDAARQDLADLWFGFDMEFDFFVPKGGQVNGEDMEFYFNGDDDIWVYIDDVLILDIAGCHGPVESWINFATGEVFNYNVGYSCGSSRKQNTTIKAQFEGALGADYVAEHMAGQFTEDGAFADYSKHTLKFFYTERGGNISYCALKFNMPALPSGSLSVGKQVEDMNGDTPAFITDALSYEFRVLEAAADGTATENLFIPVGASYAIVDANNYENVLGSGTVGADGYFTLKDGQVALFENVFTEYANSTANIQYVVEERIPSQFSGVYGEVEYVADNESVSNRVTTGDAEAQEYLTYVTPSLASDETQKVTFTNKVKVDLTGSGGAGEGEEGDVTVDPMIATLRITKQENGDTASVRQETYQICVLAGYSEDTMQPLSVGAKYTVGEANKTVEEEGIIELKAGETAELVFLEGTSYKVEEVVNSRYTYYPTYQDAEGTIAVEGTQDVAATVINTYYVPSSGGSNSGTTTTPTDPVAPTDPENPGDTTIEDEDTPLGQLPEEGVEIGEEDAPLASLPDEEPPLAVLPEEEVPMAVLPATGDASVIWMALSALSGTGLFLTRKKSDEE